jgi:tetratricopeptide (TPR) repeat protein
LVLILDDVHLADGATLDALEYAALSELKLPLFVLAMGRPQFEGGRPEWGRRAGDAPKFTLGPLEELHAQELCRVLLLPAMNAPAAAVDALVRRAQGIPLLLVELIRGLRKEGLLSQGKGQTWTVATDRLDQIPDLPVMDWLAARELKAMAKDIAAHAQLVSLLGAEFTVEEAKGVLGVLDQEGGAEAFPLDAAAGVRKLKEGGVLREVKRGILTFRSGLLRDAVERTLASPLRQRIHQAAAKFYRDLAGREPAFLGKLALHASRSGQKAEALLAYGELAQRAQSRHAFLDAESMLSCVLELRELLDEEKKMEALKNRGLMRYRLARYSDALDDFGKARAIAQTRSDAKAQVEILLDEATALDWAEDYTASKERVESALQLAGPDASPLVSARLLMGQGRTAHRFSQDLKGSELLTTAKVACEKLGDEAYETLIVSYLLNGYILSTLARYEEAEANFNAVIPICERHGDRLHLGAAVGNRSMLWLMKGEQEKMIADLNQLLEVSRELGNSRMEQVSHLNLAQFLQRKDITTAERHARQAVECDRRRGDVARPEAELLLARILAGQKRTQEALGVLGEIKERQERARKAGYKEVEYLPGEQVMATMVEFLCRQASAKEWDALGETAAKCLPGQELQDFQEAKRIALQSS